MKIKKIEYLGKPEPVFNLTVVRYHNYMTADGIILKNCDALRYFCVNFTSRAKEKNTIDTRYYMPSEIEDYIDRKEVRKPTNRINRR